MDYYFSKTLDAPFDEAIEKVTSALKDEGFGILTEIDVKATLKKKLDVDYKRQGRPRLCFQHTQAGTHLVVYDYREQGIAARHGKDRDAIRPNIGFLSSKAR